jgi:hypothetical protein
MIRALGLVSALALLVMLLSGCEATQVAENTSEYDPAHLGLSGARPGAANLHGV